MGERSAIEWTDATWNPFYGCRKVSPGCDNCYAERDMKRYGREWRVQRANDATFYAPLRWKKPRRIFTCSWSDFFIEEARDQGWLAEAWTVMKHASHHTFQILTKRPGLMADWGRRVPGGWPGHIWAGTSVESAAYLPRLDVLARVPAKVRFVSCEPLLGPLDLRKYLLGNCGAWGGSTDGRDVNWVIVGGESGPGARPMHPDWVRSIRNQCQEAGVPLFVKQDSGPHPGMQGRLPADIWAMKERPLSK